MQFVEVQKETLVEESVTVGQKICYIKMDSPGTFSIDSPHPEWIYLTNGVENDCTVYLTNAGVSAINADYPDDPTKEVQSIEFLISCTNNETGDSASQTIVVSVIRVHDEPPLITSKYFDKIFTENVNSTFRAASITTAYNSIFEVIDSYALHFEFKSEITTNRGDLYPTESGINFIKNNLIWDSTNTNVYTYENMPAQDIDIDIKITDTQNGKFITDTITLTIVQGNSDILLPTKNNTELIAEYLGENLGDILGKLEINDYSQGLTLDRLTQDLNKIIEDSFGNTKEIQDIKKRITNIIEAYKSMDGFIDDKFNINIEKYGYALFQDLIKVVSELLEFATNNDYQTTGSFNNQVIEARAFAKGSYKYTEALINYIYIWQKRLLRETLGATVSVIDQKIEDLNTKIDEQLVASFNERMDKISQWLDWSFQYLEFVSKNTYNLDARLKQITYHVGKTQTRVLDLSDKDLTSWPMRQDNRDPNSPITGWNFTISDLKYKDQKILNTSDGDMLYIRAGSSIILKTTQSSNLTLAGSGSDSTLTLDGSNSTMKAVNFEGTATKALYADLAEYYLADQEYEVGTVMSINPTGVSEITLYGQFEDMPCVGVVSNKPGFILNTEKESDDNYVLIALKGRTPVKCCGEISKGMYLYPSLENPGYAFGSFKKFFDQDLIGIALEYSDPSDDFSLIEAKI